MTQPVLLSLLAATSVFLLVYALWGRDKQRVTTRDRLYRIAGFDDQGQIVADPDRMLEGRDASLERLLKGFGVDIQKYSDAHELEFYRAGIPAYKGAVNTLAMRYLGLPVALLVAFMIYRLGAGHNQMLQLLHTLIALMVAAAPLIGPQLYVKNMRQKRAQLLMLSFPDMLDLLLVCLEAGIALDAALTRIARELEESHPVMTRELNRLRLELTMMNNREQALENFAERVDLMPYRSLVASLLQSERYGTNLADTLRVLADDQRTARMIAAEERANRLPALMTLPLILFLLPAFFIIIMGPSVIKLMTEWTP